MLRRAVRVSCVLAGSAIMVLGMLGCGATKTATVIQTVTAATTPETTTDTAPPTDTTTTDATSTPSLTATVGKSITVNGNSGEAAEATVLGVIDPVNIPPDSIDAPEQGHHMVGVRMLVKSTGTTPLDEAFDNDAKLITADDTSYDAQVTVNGPCISPSSQRISPGAQRRICLAFEIPDGTRPKTFQFTLDSGFADETGEWTLN